MLCGSLEAMRPASLTCLIVMLLAAPVSANTFLRWTQSSGVGMAGGATGSNGSLVNQYGGSTSLQTVLSEGIVEQIQDGVVQQTVDYRVLLHTADLLFFNQADDLTNNAFVIHEDGQADWYSAITGSGTVALQFDFFEKDSGFTTREAVELSLTSPHRQPDAVDPLAAEVKKLHYNEVYDIQMSGTSGPPSRSFTDSFNQLQQGIAAGTMPDGSAADFSMGWAEPGFGNDTNGDGNLDVGEAQFTFDLSAAETFVISRSKDNGKRSALAFTAEGFFGGSEIEVPEPRSALLLLGAVLAWCGLARGSRTRQRR